MELSLIQVDTDAAAAQAKQRITDGETFEEVAKDVSKHNSATAGGALGWVPHDLLATQLADVAFAQEPGTLSDVVETDNGFYLLRVDAKETRAVDDSTKSNLINHYWNQRLDDAATKYNPQNLLTVGQAQRIAAHVVSAGG